jgi:glycogen synthase
MTTPENLKILVSRIQAQPGLEKRIEAILDIIENKSGELITADQAEDAAIEEIKKLGQELLKGWALNQHDRATETAQQTHSNTKKHGKKNSIGNSHLEK